MTFQARSLLLKSVAVAAIAASLSACFPLLVGGAAVGALVAVDRRTSGTVLEDEGIEIRANNRLRSTVGDRGHVNVTSYNRQVLLTGEVPNEQTKQQAEQTVAAVENVKGIVNELAITANASLTQRSSDVLTQGKVKATFVDARDVFAGAFKVVVERGTVYLMGRVSQREADRATQLTRTVGGVQKVVRIFEIISEEELQRIVPASPPPATSAPRS